MTPFAVLITCEHASALVPEGIELGLTPAILATHVSTDRGAEEIALALAEVLGAPVHLGAQSRLVVDLNRREDNPDVIVETTYGLAVPGNVGLSPRDREERIARFHRPYREAARADALRLAERGGCLHLSIHSFDPSLDPVARAFDAGVLFDPSRSPEDALAARLAAELGARELSVRLNEPYLGTPEGLTSWLRAQIPQERYVGIEIEACQGWMDRPGALMRFAGELAAAVRALV